MERYSAIRAHGTPFLFYHFHSPMIRDPLPFCPYYSRLACAPQTCTTENQRHGRRTLTVFVFIWQRAGNKLAATHMAVNDWISVGIIDFRCVFLCVGFSVLCCSCFRTSQLLLLLLPLYINRFVDAEKNMFITWIFSFRLAIPSQWLPRWPALHSSMRSMRWSSPTYLDSIGFSFIPFFRSSSTAIHFTREMHDVIRLRTHSIHCRCWMDFRHFLFAPLLLISFNPSCFDWTISGSLRRLCNEITESN